jgi:hypothetical protein
MYVVFMVVCMETENFLCFRNEVSFFLLPFKDVPQNCYPISM